MIGLNAANQILQRCTSQRPVLWTSRATTAIYLILKTVISSGSFVIIPDNVCFSVVAAIIFSGNIPYFVDIDMESQSISPRFLKNIEDAGNAAVIYPYMYGICHEDIAEIKNICHQKGWYLIEDCAQSLGGKVGSANIGSFGNAAVFSFGAGKIIDSGGGGCMTTTERRLLEECEKLYSVLPEKSADYRIQSETYNQSFKKLYALCDEHRDVDLSSSLRLLIDRYRNIFIHRADNPTIDGIIDSLRALDNNLARRLHYRDQFEERFRALGVPSIIHPAGSTYWRFNILVHPAIRSSLLNCLHAGGFHASSWFPSIDRYYRARNEAKSPYPNSDYVSDRIINLWLNHEIDDSYINGVSSVIKEFLEKVRNV